MEQSARVQQGRKAEQLADQHIPKDIQKENPPPVLRAAQQQCIREQPKGCSSRLSAARLLQGNAICRVDQTVLDSALTAAVPCSALAAQQAP